MDSFVQILVLATCFSLRGCLAETPADREAPERWNGSVTVEVDKLSGVDCRDETLEQSIICDSLVDVLSLLSQDPSTTAVEVVISEGTYLVQGTFIIARDVLKIHPWT